MNTQSIDSTILVEELQLGEKLNQCVHSHRRADFALMLSMLTDDVRAQSQFKLPQTVQDIKEVTEQTLRKRFDLPEKERLALRDLIEIDEFSQANLVQEQHLTTLHLQQALKPKPLAFRDDKHFITTNVMENTSLYCQQQHKKQQAQQSPTQRLSFNVNEWLKTVQTTIVKAPLLDAMA